MLIHRHNAGRHLALRLQFLPESLKHLIPASQSFYTSGGNSICFSKRPIRMLMMSFPIHGSMDQWDNTTMRCVSFYSIRGYIWGPDDQYSMRFLQTGTMCCTEWRFRLYLLLRHRGCSASFSTSPNTTSQKRQMQMSIARLFLICDKNERVRSDDKSYFICTHCISVCVPAVAFYTGLITQHENFSARACENSDNDFQSPLQVLNRAAVNSKMLSTQVGSQLSIHEMFSLPMQSISHSSSLKHCSSQLQ